MRRPSMRALSAAAGALAIVAGATACATVPGPDPGRVDVVAAIYPLRFVSERVGGDDVRVIDLTKPGAEPHDLELSPRQVAEVSQAELIIYLKGLQPAVDDAIEQEGGDRAFDVTRVQPLRDAPGGGHTRHEGDPGGKDLHVWLDPVRLATIADRIAERLSRVDPGHAAGYASRAGELRTELQTLDHEYAQGLNTCQRRQIIVSHAAFGYLADRYDLTQIGVAGLSPESEPSPRRIAEVAATARGNGATTIFFETLVSPKLAQTIADEAGARTAVLDPIEGLPSGGDYLSVMRANLTALRLALECR